MNREYIKEIEEVLKQIDTSLIDEFVKMLKLSTGFKSTVFTAGNGGSDCDAKHFAQDCISYVINKGGTPIRSHAIGANTGLSTAIANDYGYKKTIVKELKIYSRKNAGDILVLMSGSGNSENLVEAAKWANDNGVAVVSFVGFNGGILKSLSNICIHLPTENWGIIHGCTSLLFHYILDKYLK